MRAAIPKRTDALGAAELAEGARRFVRAGGCEFALFHVHDQLYVLEESCPHNGASLAGGMGFIKETGAAQCLVEALRP